MKVAQTEEKDENNISCQILNIMISSKAPRISLYVQIFNMAI